MRRLLLLAAALLCLAAGAQAQTPSQAPTQTAKRLLLLGEPTHPRGAIVINTVDFSTGWTLVGIGAPIANAATGPDGSNNAWRLAETATAGNHDLHRPTAKAATAIAYVLDIVGKAAERTRAQLRLADSAGTNFAAVTFDLAGGAIGVAAAATGNFSNVSATIIPMTGGWWRCRLIATSNTDTTIDPFYILDNASGSAASSISYTGNTSNGILIFSAKLQVY